MTTKYIFTYMAAGYTLSSAYSALVIETKGGIGGTGLFAPFGAQIYNYGVVYGHSGSAGMFLKSGSVRNGNATVTRTSIRGNAGVEIGGIGSVANYGTIDGLGRYGGNGVNLGGGSVTNGTSADTTALIEGVVDGVYGAGSVTNFGTINGGSEGVVYRFGASVTNGASDDTTALIEGGNGILISGGTVANYGTIDGLGGTFADAGVYLTRGGSVVNGGSGDTQALIEGHDGILMGIGNELSVTNFGTIAGTGGRGVKLRAGGSVVNGSNGDTKALIETAGSNAVSIYNYAGRSNYAGTVTNFGMIKGMTGGVYQGAAFGMVTNGSGADETALISGANGLDLNGSSTVVNSGTIMGTGGAASYGLYTAATATGVTLTNGSMTNTAALIEGFSGLQLHGKAEVVNFGTILATGAAHVVGVYMGGSGSLTNGAAGHQTALIEGVYGVDVRGALAATVTNFGTIKGGAYSVRLASASDVLIVEAGSTFVGAVQGGGGTLDLASGSGTLTALGAGNVTVSGSMAPTTFTNFATLEVGVGASFAVSGNGSIAAGQSLIDAGTLTVGGALTVAGALTTTRLLAGAGTLAITGGAEALKAGTILTIAKVTESGVTTQVNVATSLTYAGHWTQTTGTVSVAAGDRLTFTGAGDSFGGTLTGAGAIDFGGGSDTLRATTLTAASVLINAAAVTLAGTITNTGKIVATTPNLIVSANNATLTGGGQLVLTQSSANSIHGATAAALLTNVDNNISGAGALGGGAMVLVNQAKGIINGNGALALTIDTGAATIVNAGVIEVTGSGGVTIQSAVANTGLLDANSGDLTVNGAVSGAGTAAIHGGTLAFASSFTENVAFRTAGVLRLARSQAYTGSISGFSKTGATSLDLGDIAFNSAGEATFSGTTAGGTLTVTDGTHTAKIKLVGDYTGSTFIASSDGHGGTNIIDPAAAVRAPAQHQFIAAMASLDAGAPSHGYEAAEPWREARHSLCAPRCQVA